jgi:CSLREA domain-containing protein
VHLESRVNLLRVALIASLVSLATVLVALPGRAADSTFAVSKQDDTADGTCDADCSLREAILAANAVGGVSLINVPASADHYLITIGFGDDAGSAGDFDVTADITIVGQGIDQTMIDGNSVDTVFHVASGASLTLRDLTVRGGKALESSLAGGIYAEGHLWLDSVAVSENTGAIHGAGGVYATQPTLIEHSIITMNTGLDEGVGGLFATAGTNIDNSSFTQNTASGVSSVGGIRFEGQTVLVSAVVSGNSASGQSSVGGVYTGPGHNADFRRTTIAENTATGDFAVGGWWNATSAVAENLTVDSNSGGNHGVGGVYIECCDGGLELSRAAVTSNAGGDDGGGGIWNESAAIVTNVTVSGNTAGAAGAGGVYNAGLLTLVNDTIADNSAGSGGSGALWNEEEVTVRNSIFSAEAGTECINNDSIESEGGNLSAGASCGLTEGSDHENADPGLGPLSDNGGFSQSRALMNGSPAIDAGVDCPPPRTDQRGAVRPEGSCDSGAFEVGELATFQAKFGDIQCTGTIGPEDVLSILRDAIGHQDGVASCPGPADHVMIAGCFDVTPWADVNCDGREAVDDGLFLLSRLADLAAQDSESCPALGETVTFQ